jgi:hypothetical protein
MRKRVLALAILLSAATASTALAQPPPTSTPTPTPTPTSTPGETVVREEVVRPRDPFWQTRYEEARAKLLVGEFQQAADMFASLEETAANEADGRLVHEQKTLAQEWAKKEYAFVKRNDLGESTLSAKATDRRTTDELVSLYAYSVFYGVGTGGWLAAQTQPKGAAGVVLPMIGFSGAAVGAVALLDSGRGFHYGVPQAIVSGMNIGVEEGVTLALWNGQQKSRDRWDGKTVASIVWIPGTAFAVAGGVIAENLGTTPGQGSWVGSAGLWTGSLAGLLTAAFSDSKQGEPFLAGALALNVGAVAGMLSAGAVSPSIARVRFLDLGAVSGGLLFGGLYVALADKNANGHAGAGMTALGIGAGLGTAWALTAGMPDDRREKKEAPAAAVTVRPTVSPVGDGATLGFAGTF